mmetsp:Transcript_127566/g.369305  ORF Transcript_127566/g.369305 Transcript_127566/m.369305 type:complete len:115 (+) Transcript_127566:436-780(+)
MRTAKNLGGARKTEVLIEFGRSGKLSLIKFATVTAYILNQSTKSASIFDRHHGTLTDVGHRWMCRVAQENHATLHPGGNGFARAQSHSHHTSGNRFSQRLDKLVIPSVLRQSIC